MAEKCINKAVDAGQICRPNSDWLIANQIVQDQLDDDFATGEE